MLLKMGIIISACYEKVFLLKSRLFQLLPINILLAKLLLQFVFFRCHCVDAKSFGNEPNVA